MATELELLNQNTATFRDEGSPEALLKGKTRAAETRALVGNIIKTIFTQGSVYQPVPEDFEWVTVPTITVSGNTISISTAEALWAGVSVLYAATTITATLPADPYLRADGVFALANGTYGYKEGPLGMSHADPAIPAEAAPVGNVYWRPSGGSVTQPAAVDYGPVGLSDAVSVTFDTKPAGQVRPNAALTFTGTPLLQTLIIANTLPGYHYQVRLKNCSGQQVTISPISGVSYLSIKGEVLTTITLPASGDCILTYYHASSSERLVEILNGSAPETFTPITENQFSTHPPFTSQHDLNVWLLTNAYTK